MARTKTSNNISANKILQSARKLFIKNGFNGTSINDIANEAMVNKSLIYHHFQDKKTLWKAVKEDIIKNYAGESLENLSFESSNLREFLEKVVTFRFNLYANNPEMVRLMIWQKLEEDHNSLTGIKTGHFNTLVPEIIKLKEKGEIRKDIDNEILNYLIFSLSSNAFIDQVEFLQGGKENHSQYLKTIIDFLYKAIHQL